MSPEPKSDSLATSPPQAETTAVGGRRWRLPLAKLLLAAVGLLLGVGVLGMIVRGYRNEPVEATKEIAGGAIAPQPPPVADWKPALASTLSAAEASSTPSAAALASTAKSVASLLAALPEGGKLPEGTIVASGGATQTARSAPPRHERWEFEFAPGNTVESYARQLDYFKIELAVIGGSDAVTYISNLSDPAPKARMASAQDETRLYLVWARGAMRDADEQLAARAKVSTNGKAVVHFCPPQVETELQRLEDAEAANKQHAQVERTRFGIRPNGFGGYQFYVVEQQGRRS